MNSMMDVVVGMVSFVPTYFWGASVMSGTVLLAFAAITSIDLIMSTFGWIATRKAYVLEQRLLMEYRDQREQMRMRRKQMHQRIEEERSKWRVRRKAWKARKRELQQKYFRSEA